MNICISYGSSFGNGKTCVDELTALLKKKGHDVARISIKETKPTDLPRADLYVFSSPTRAGQPLGKVKGFIKKGAYPENAGFSIISTGVDESTGALGKLADAAAKAGLKKAADGVRIKVKGIKGPLTEEYKDKLNTFAEQLDSFKK